VNWMVKISRMVMTPTELKETDFGYFRFVRVHGDYRFSDATDNRIGHRDLAGREIPESAGFIKIRGDEFEVEGHSMALGIGWDGKDEDNLSALLGKIPTRFR